MTDSNSMIDNITNDLLNRYVRLSEAAKLSGVDAQTIKHWCLEKRIKYMRIPGQIRNTYRVHLGDFVEFVKKHEVLPTNQTPITQVILRNDAQVAPQITPQPEEKKAKPVKKKAGRPATVNIIPITR